MSFFTVEDSSSEKKAKGKTVFLVVGFLLLILGVASISGGGVILFLNLGTDSEGYALSNVYRVDSSAYAFILEIGSLRIVTPYAQLANQIFGSEAVAQAKWVVYSVNSSRELFVGYAKAADVKTYVNRMEIEYPYPYFEWSAHQYYANINIPSTAVSRAGFGGPARSPSMESFWLTSAHSNESAVYFSPIWGSQEDNRCLVIMNLDGSKGVEADIRLGFKVPILGWLPYLLIPLGIGLCLCGLFLYRKRKR